MEAIVSCTFPLLPALGEKQADHIKKPDHAPGHPSSPDDDTASALIASSQHRETARGRGPMLMQDYQLLEKLAHQNRERVVHAKGWGAYCVLPQDPAFMNRYGSRTHFLLERGGRAVPGHGPFQDPAAPPPSHRPRGGRDHRPHPQRLSGGAVRQDRTRRISLLRAWGITAGGQRYFRAFG